MMVAMNVRLSAARLSVMRMLGGPSGIQLAFVGSLGCVVACGGAVGAPREEPAQAGSSGVDVGGASSEAGGSSTRGGTSGGAGAGGVTSTYVDPGCPNTPVPETYEECSPLGSGSECGDTMGCYPVTEYPSAPCEPEIFQMLCLPSGNRGQWESCESITDCIAGHTCVVTGNGTMCLKMCDPEGASSCPTGLFCDGVDLQGIGICF